MEVGVSHRPREAGESTVSIHHIPKVLTSLLRYWWNKVQFPTTAQLPQEVSTEHEKRYHRYQYVLLVMAACFLLCNLSYPLIDRDETRYAEIPREMLASGNWIVPQLNFEPYYDKPPLVYWLCAVSYSLFGVSEWSARLVPVLAALLTLASTMWFGSRWFGRRIALYSGVVLMLSAGFLFCSRYLLLDGVLTALVATSLMSAYEALRASHLRSSWWIFAATLCGLAFLVKGPLAIVLIVPPIAAYSWLSDSCPRIRAASYATFFGVVMAIVVPWIALVGMADSQYLYEFFVKHNLRRFAGEMHARPIWYFIPVVLLAGHPWSSLTIPLTRFLTGRSEDLRLRRPPAMGFLVLFSGWTFLFFSVSSCKLPTYLLPAAPPLALIVGNYLAVVLRDQKVESFRIARVWSAKLATVMTCLAALGFLAYTYYSQSELSMALYLWTMIWTAIAVGSLLLIRSQPSSRNSWQRSTLITALFGFMVMHHLVPSYSRTQSLFGPESPLHSIPASKIATISHEFSEVPFYLNRSDVANVSPQELRTHLADKDEALLIVHHRLLNSQLHQSLPADASIDFVARRGPAKILRFQRITSVARNSTANSHAR